jgi:hypothetical protein
MVGMSALNAAYSPSALVFPFRRLYIPLNQPKARAASEWIRVVVPTKYIVKKWLVDWRRMQIIKTKKKQ